MRSVAPLPLVLTLSGAVLAAACGSSPGGAAADGASTGDAAARCTPGSAGVVDAFSFPASVDAFCQVSIRGAAMVPVDATVVPYELNTPLFSDYAVKQRTVWLPSGSAARYVPDGPLLFPVGTVITKSFGWPDDFREPNAPVHWVETRVLVRTPKHGWVGASYRWNADQTGATLAAGGGVLSFSFVDSRGQTLRPKYLIPTPSECPKCHANEGVFTTLGPSSAQLNRAYRYADGSANQLARWSELGILTGAPAPGEAPALPVWDDPATGTTEQRARAYLQGNCAFCHSGKGEARTTGLVLSDSETDPAKYGVCKAPVAAGRAAGSLQFDVVPRHPEASILIRRVTLTEPSVAMPELERSLEHVEGVALLRRWVEELPGSCP